MLDMATFPGRLNFIESIRLITNSGPLSAWGSPPELKAADMPIPLGNCEEWEKEAVLMSG